MKVGTESKTKQRGGKKITPKLEMIQADKIWSIMMI